MAVNGNIGSTGIDIQYISLRTGINRRIIGTFTGRRFSNDTVHASHRNPIIVFGISSDSEVVKRTALS